ncbi:MAG: carbohydrate kinase [Treponema sp.]|jgi:L-xylulokinase|nr:carbohydrate kinase [Treponema sp.]
MEQYVLGIDNGGTVIKAALFSLDGKETASASCQTKLLTPKPGYTERDMDELWEQNCACIRQVLSVSGIKGEAVAGVGVCGHGKGLYPWGKNGRPVKNGIISTDNRAWQYPEKWKADGTFDALYPRLCQQIMACQPVSILAWMKDHDRAAYDSIRWVFSVTDYIRFRLTGEAYSEATNISGSGLFNVRDVKIEEDMLDAFGIGEAFAMIPPVRYSGDLCGKINAEAAALTGLPEGTGVAGGMFDIDACAIAMSITEPGQLCTITGTWSINECIAPEPVTGTCIAMNSLYAIPGWYLLEESSATGVGNLEWLIRNIFEHEQIPEGKKLYAYLDEKAAQIPESCDVYFLPFLYGSNRHPLGKASFIGLTSYHSKYHMLRALYEGAAFSAKHHIDKLLSVREKPGAIRLAGGAANSTLWVQIYADILELPVETVKAVKELGAQGAGMAAAVSAGLFRDYREAAAAMVRITEPVEPDAAKFPVYRKKYAAYEAICAALDQVWNRFEV